MGSNYLIGLDAGGGGVRCLLANLQNQSAEVVGRSWRHRPVPDTGGWGHDFDTHENWKLLAESVREALSSTGVRPSDIAAIGLTSMRHGIVLLDGEGREVFGSPNIDARAASEGMAMALESGELIHRRTGHWPNPIFASARLRWMKDNLPDLFLRADKLLSISDWVGYRLTGELATEPTQASETGLFDLEKNQWAEDLIERLELPPSLLPELRPSGAQLGVLLEPAARALGLRPGIPVVSGGADTQCGLVGIGVIRVGEAGLIAGSTATAQMVMDSSTPDPEGRMWTCPHVVPGKWVRESNAGAAGEALEWMAEFLYPGEAAAVAHLLGDANTSRPGAAGILSTFGVTVMDARKLALPVGSLSFSHFMARREPDRRRHFARATLEGIAFGLKANLVQLAAGVEAPHPVLRLGGGLSRSRTFSTILSSVLNRTIDGTPVPDSSALGAAVLAGVGAGIFESVEDGVGALLGAPVPAEPVQRDVQLYDEIYEAWTSLRAATNEAGDAVSTYGLRAIAEDAAPAAPSTGASVRPRILVTADMDEAGLAALRRIGDVTHASFRDEMRLLTGPDLVDALKGFQVFITEIDVVDVAALQDLHDLKVIAACRGNAVNVDLRACTAFGIPVLHAPGRNADAVADLAMAFMLMLVRKLAEANAFLRAPGLEAGDMARMGVAFDQLQGQELWNKTVGLVGLGAIGRRVAERLRGFGCRIVAYDPRLTPEEVARVGAELVDLQHLLANSDIISLHAAVTQDTRGLIGEQQFETMKPTAFLINTARAALLDEEALVEALTTQKIAGAALDVFAVEPPGADHPLLKLPNVIATPHVAGNTVEIGSHQGRIIAADLGHLAVAETPHHVLNPETLATFSWEKQPRTVPPEVLAELHDAPPPTVSDIEQHETPPGKRGPSQRKTASGPRDGLPATHRASPAGAGQEPRWRKGVADRIERSIYAPARAAGAYVGRFLGKKGKPEAGAPRSEAGASRSEAGASRSEACAATAAPPGPSKEAFERVLKAFIDRAKKDGDLQAFGVTHRVSTLYTLREPDIKFYLAFEDGSVDGALGTPETAPNVRLKMKADVLDGMFTGRINPTRAAMTGKLSFSGDTRLAMGMQRVQKTLCRLYAEARDAVGPPDAAPWSVVPTSGGGLEDRTPPKVSEATPAASARVPPSPLEVGQSEVTVGDPVKVELVHVVKELYSAGLITATGGNVSARITGADEAWITPGQLFKGDLRTDILVRINLDGDQIDASVSAPSSERLMHCAVFRSRDEVEAVIHAHAPYATTLGLCGLPFLPISTEAAFVRELPIVPFIMPGTRELADAVVETLGDKSAVSLQNHGILVAASSLRRAADIVEVIERTSEVLLRCHAAGQTPPVLPEDVLEELYELGRMMA